MESWPLSPSSNAKARYTETFAGPTTTGDASCFVSSRTRILPTRHDHPPALRTASATLVSNGQTQSRPTANPAHLLSTALRQHTHPGKRSSSATGLPHTASPGRCRCRIRTRSSSPLCLSSSPSTRPAASMKPTSGSSCASPGRARCSCTVPASGTDPSRRLTPLSRRHSRSSGTALPRASSSSSSGYATSTSCQRISPAHLLHMFGRQPAAASTWRRSHSRGKRVASYRATPCITAW